MFGTLNFVNRRVLGDSLTAAATVGATTLQVDFVADFNEDGGQLALNGATLGYDTVDPDLETITLSSPLAVAAAVDDRVDVVDGGTVAAQWVADVSIDEGDNVSATIPTALSRYFSEGTQDQPQSVQIGLDEHNEYVVTTQPNVEPVFDGAAVWNPYVTANMLSFTVPDSAWTQVTGWNSADLEIQGMTLDDGVESPYPGRYQVISRATFASNGTGRRGIRVIVDGVTAETFLNSADPSGQTFSPILDLVTITDQSKVTIQVYQSSGAGLSLFSGTLSMFRISS